jgi:hypothetical protein
MLITSTSDISSLLYCYKTESTLFVFLSSYFIQKSLPNCAGYITTDWRMVMNDELGRI